MKGNNDRIQNAKCVACKKEAKHIIIGRYFNGFNLCQGHTKSLEKYLKEEIETITINSVYC